MDHTNDLSFLGRATADNCSSIARVESNIYSKMAVLCAAYRQSEHFQVSVNFDSGLWIIKFTPRHHSDKPPVKPVDRFLDDLVDYQLRHEMDESFRPLRELIAARAFAGLK